MTTEIAILNKSAVALAADSAVTISRNADHSSVAKIYVDANKLFELVKGRPVGIMIYNGATVAGVPWETLIKEYRLQNAGRAFDRLEEYADDFVSFVASALTPFMKPEDELRQIADSFLPLMDQLYQVFLPQVMVERGRVARRDVLGSLIDRLETVLDARDVCDWALGIDEAALWDRWKSDLVPTVVRRRPELTLTDSVARKFARLTLKAFLRIEASFGAWSGIVIAGFGEREFFPTVCHAHISGFIHGRLVKVESAVDSISNGRPAIIEPYAQTSEALMFLQGIDPAVSRAIETFWRSWTDNLEDDVMKIIHKESQINEAHRNAICTRLAAHFSTSWDGFSKFMDEEFHKKRLEPIEGSAAFLSKREIADLAENLVDLTSLRNRVSLDRQETVGGATDVAVISKGDGFVWVKRKHYFDLEHNPAWPTRQVLTDVVSTVSQAVDADGGEQ